MLIINWMFLVGALAGAIILTKKNKEAEKVVFPQTFFHKHYLPDGKTADLTYSGVNPEHHLQIESFKGNMLSTGFLWATALWAFVSIADANLPYDQWFG